MVYFMLGPYFTLVFLVMGHRYFKIAKENLVRTLTKRKIGWFVLYIIMSIIISRMDFDILPYGGTGWFYLAFIVFVAIRILRLRDYQLADPNKQLEIATKKQDLDRYLTGTDLLVRKDLASQLFGVRTLTLSLDTDLASRARAFLKNMLKKNWGPEKTKGNREIRSEVRDEIILTLYRKDKQLDLSSFDLREANLSGKDFIGVNLSSANLSSANLNGTNLSQAKLSGADLSGTNLREATLSDVDLSHANLSLANFEKAKGLDRIRFFEGIWANKGSEPKGLPDILMEEMQRNLKEPFDYNGFDT